MASQGQSASGCRRPLLAGALGGQFASEERKEARYRDRPKERAMPPKPTSLGPVYANSGLNALE